MNDTELPRPLAGLRVVDLTRALAGPYATLLLAGLGAEVIKVEDPRGGDLARENSPYIGRDGVTVERAHADDISISHLSRARGKRGISLNLKAEGAKEIFADLCRGADIVVENFAAGTADRLGVGYEAAKSARSDIIYCSLSGFGADRPDGKAMDVIIQALSGAMYTSGDPDAPPVRMGIPIADMLAPVFGVIGILSALQHRNRTGEGCYIDQSQAESGMHFMSTALLDYEVNDRVTERNSNRDSRRAPHGVYPAAGDDKWVAISVEDEEARARQVATGTPVASESS